MSEMLQETAPLKTLLHINILWDTIVDESVEPDTRLSDENSRDGVVAGSLRTLNSLRSR